MIFFENLGGHVFEPEQAWLHEVISEHCTQLRIFPMLGRRAYFYKL
jgi:hypothetical protein